MTLKELFEDVANKRWFFFYGRKDYQNLIELEKDVIGLFVEPIVEDPKFNEYGEATMTYSGRFLLAVHSDVDEEYDYKFETYIKPIKENQLPFILTALQCNSYKINQFRILEVINMEDMNVDGKLVSYNLTLID
ncbi:MAG: hypothetical protein EOO50_05240 [Flavobacterium sp.]|uniref:hypothetical protein n=1 Tax=Flavobacterium sp. TaxID=239 RepID=UPI00121B19E4|nr:hypothetical protein [Flavobacterium sp.]RZJ67688.1 MAG: hypothetical protein EOO50_05240 [Flavobacterium sp.]